MAPRALRFLAGALLAAGLASAALKAADAWPDGVPKQPVDPVTDLAGMLSDGAASHLNQELRRQWQEGHFQLAVLIVPGLGGRSIEDESIQVARGWGMGDKEKSNGVLMLIAPSDHKVRIEVGSRLEGDLPDVVCHRIIAETMTPLLRQHNADGAVLAGASAITERLSPSDPLAAEGAQAQDASGPVGGAGASVAGLGILGFLAWLIFGHPLILLLLAFIILTVLRSAFGGPGGGYWGGGFGGGGFGGGGFGGGGGGFGGGFGGGGFSGGGGGFSGGGSSGGW